MSQPQRKERPKVVHIKPKRPRLTGGKVGRPPSPDGEVTLHIRSTGAEREEWEREAKRVKMRVSTFVKMAVNKHIADERAARRAEAAAAAAGK